MSRAGILVSWPIATTPIYEAGAARVRTYECHVCHRVDVWGPSWGWFGSLANIDGGMPGSRAPKPMIVVCSSDCADAIPSEESR